MDGFMLACVALYVLLAVAPEARADVDQLKTKSSAGALGWGLSLYVPTFGPLSHVPLRNKSSWGYVLSAGASYDVWESWSVDAHITTMQTINGRVYLSYASGTERVQLSQSAQWHALLATIGATYVWRPAGAVLQPFVGGNFVFGHGGYVYNYSNDAYNLLASPPTKSPLSPPPDHSALSWQFGAGVRSGVRLQALSWLAAQTECSFQWLPLSSTPVTNNREIRDVKTAAHQTLLSALRWSVVVTL